MIDAVILGSIGFAVAFLVLVIIFGIKCADCQGTSYTTHQPPTGHISYSHSSGVPIGVHAAPVIYTQPVFPTNHIHHTTMIHETYSTGVPLGVAPSFPVQTESFGYPIENSDVMSTSCYEDAQSSISGSSSSSTGSSSSSASTETKSLIEEPESSSSQDSSNSGDVYTESSGVPLGVTQDTYNYTESSGFPIGQQADTYTESSGVPLDAGFMYSESSGMPLEASTYADAQTGYDDY